MSDATTGISSASRTLGASQLLGLPLRSSERRLILLLGDIVVVLGAGLAALAAWAALRPGIAFNCEFVTLHGPWLVGLTAAWLVLCAANGAYDLKVAARVRVMNRRLVVTALIFGLLYLALFFALSALLGSPYSTFFGLGRVRPLRVVPTLFIVFALVVELTWRNLYQRLLTGERFRRRVIVVGVGWAGRTIAQVLCEHDDGTYQLVGFIDDDPAKQGTAVILGQGERGRGTEGDPSTSSGQRKETRRRSSPHPIFPSPCLVLGDRHTVKDLIIGNGVSTLILAITHQVNSELLATLLDCLELGVEIVPMAVLHERLTGRVPVEHIGDNWYMAMPVHHPGVGGFWPLAKRLPGDPSGPIAPEESRG